MAGRHALVAVPQAAELLLPGSVPHVEDELATVGVELKGMHLDAQSRDVLFLELTGLFCTRERREENRERWAGSICWADSQRARRSSMEMLQLNSWKCCSMRQASSPSDA